MGTGQRCLTELDARDEYVELDRQNPESQWTTVKGELYPLTLCALPLTIYIYIYGDEIKVCVRMMINRVDVNSDKGNKGHQLKHRPATGDERKMGGH